MRGEDRVQQETIAFSNILISICIQSGSWKEGRKTDLLVNSICLEMMADGAWLEMSKQCVISFRILLTLFVILSNTYMML